MSCLQDYILKYKIEQHAGYQYCILNIQLCRHRKLVGSGRVGIKEVGVL